MRISDVLRSKGNVVVTISPTATVTELLTLLAEHGIGACVVSTDGQSVQGIVSERDVVRALAARGAGVVDEPVSEIMTGEVYTCDPSTHTDELISLMTEVRSRHVPVLVDDRLAGIVSIGDVVKIRMIELDTEREALAAYIASGSS